jgi:hypothetical protein
MSKIECHRLSFADGLVQLVDILKRDTLLEVLLTDGDLLDTLRKQVAEEMIEPLLYPVYLLFLFLREGRGEVLSHYLPPVFDDMIEYDIKDVRQEIMYPHRKKGQQTGYTI